MAPGRVVVMIGRGDSARRTIGLEPVKVREFEAATELIRELANGRTADWNGKQITLEWAKDLPEIPVWVAGYGPRALAVAGRQGNGVVIQLADADIIDWIMGQARAAAEEAGRDPDLLEPIVCAPAVISDDIAAARDASRWFPAMVSNHVVDLLKRYDQSLLPRQPDRLPRAARVLRLLRAQPHGRQARRVRRRRDLRPLLHPRHRRGSHREAPRARGARRQAVQHVPDDRCSGGALPRLRRAHHPAARGLATWRSPVSRERAIADLRALAELTGGPGGARRLCWTDEWENARGLLREALAELPVEVDVDEAGNLWARLAGARPETVVIGSHIDSVPNGGWLDGALGVMGALETLRALAEAGTPPCTVRARRLGRRGGRALRAQPVRLVRRLRDARSRLRARPARRERRAARGCGGSARRRPRSRARGAARGCATCAPTSSCTSSRGRCSRASACPVGTVLGTVGVERNRVIFRGQAAHAGLDADDRTGATPSWPRRASRSRCATPPSATAACARPAARPRSRASSRRSPARRRSCSISGTSTPACSPPCWPSRTRSPARPRRPRGARVEWEPIWRIEPIPFDRGPDRGRPPAPARPCRGAITRCPRGRCTTRPRWRATCRR